MNLLSKPDFSDLEKIYKLINDVFRSEFSPTMQYEFSNLFSEYNLDNIFYSKENEIVVSHLAYFPADLHTETGNYKLAFLGAVATHEDFRKMGLASQLLNKAEEKMKDEKTDFCIISGDLPLYIKNGYVKTGKTFSFKIKSLKNDIETIRYNDKYINDILNIYANEKIKFRRSKDFFLNSLGTLDILNLKGEKSLKISQIGLTFLDKNKSCYFVMRGNSKSVLEYAGERNLLLKSLECFCYENNKEIILEIPESDDYFLTVMYNNRYKPEEVHSFPPFHTVKSFNGKILPKMPLPGLNFV